MKDLGLYLHIPFCVRKCRYCDFLSFSADEELRKIYAAALIREIRGYAETAAEHHVSSIFIGGGTPSLMPARQLREIMKAVYDSFSVDSDAEITMEMNPGTVSDQVVSFVYDHVNRVSMGVQSAIDAEAEMLGRIHTFHDAESGVKLLRDAGIRNINLDLMSGIPGQTLRSWEESLKRAIDLQPEHISAYSLIIEEGTPFGRLYDRGELELPDEDTERAMYHLTGEILAQNGYEHYEISNYAKAGYRCRHNLRYWTRGDYLGFGLGASSLFEHTRWHNTENFNDYLKLSSDPQRIICDMQNIDVKTAVEEFMFLGLRTMDGVQEQKFRHSFGLELSDVYGEVLKKHIKDGFVLRNGEGSYCLSERGVDVSSIVLADYLLN